MGNELDTMIDSDNKSGNNDVPSSPKSEAEDRIVERLKVCRSMAIDFATEHFPLCLKSLDDRLYELAEKSGNNQEQARLFEVQKEFRENFEALQHYFCGSVGEAYIKFKKGTLDTRTDESDEGSHLSLLENEKLEESIAVSSIALRADSHFAELIWKLNQRYAVLHGGAKVQESNNPSSPIQFCESLRRALSVISLDAKSKIIAYKIFDKNFVPKIGRLLEEINDYLISEGLLPNLHFTPGVDRSPMPPAGAGLTGNEAPNSQAPAYEGDGGYNRSERSAQYQGDLINAIRELQGHLGQGGSMAGAPLVGGAAPSQPGGINFQGSGNVAPPGAFSPGGVPAGGAGSRTVTVYSNQQLVGALQNMQTQALSLTSEVLESGGTESVLVPQGIATTSNLLTKQLQADNEDDAAVDHSDMHTIDLVGMLFEYMLADDNLPPSVKALLSYLHTPFLKIAFIDKDFFEQAEHPARLLLNNLAEAGTKWVSNDGSSQYDIYPKIKSVVSRLLEDFENDVRIFAELLLEFSAYTKKVSRRQDLMERRALEKVQGEEKLREVKVRVNQEVRGRMDGKKLPSAVLLLLLQPWSDYLSFILLRYGDESDSWADGLALVDEILWSLEPKDNNDDKTRQVELVDTIATQLEAGFETIAYDQIKAKKLLDALFSLQKLALQCKEVEAATDVMRDKLETMASEKAGDTVVEEEITASERKMVENLKLIEFGTWFEFKPGTRLKVAWYNSKTSHYMLVDQMGKKVAMKSGLELARDMIAGDAKVIAGSTKPFFERALENILHSLNSQAEVESKDDAAETRDE